MVAPLRAELGALPGRLQRLAVDDRGYPVPWFVQWIDGRPDFRVIDTAKFATAIRERRCWVCGGILGKHQAFVIGPMCALNRASAEPPSHYDCARWSAEHCPFLSRPHMVRREDAVTALCDTGDASIMRNPGCAGVWVTAKGYHVEKTPGASGSGYIIRMGEPERIEWYAEGRRATRAEVEHSIATGMPLLLEACEREKTPRDRDEARQAVAQYRQLVDQWLPAW